MNTPGPALWQPEFDIEHRPDGTIVMAQKGVVTPLANSIPERLVHWAKVAPDRIYLGQRDASGEWRTMRYSQVLTQVRQIGAGLLSLGLGPDKPLLVLSGNDIEHALIGLAAQYVGVPYAPISTAYSLVSSDHAKLRDIALLLKPGAVFVADGAAYGKAIAAIASPDLAVIATENLAEGQIDFKTLSRTLDTDTADAAFAKLTPDTVAKYLFTSGSTGSPKAVINTQHMLTSNQDMIADCFRFLADHPPVVCEWAPWNHTAGGNKTFNMVLYNGGTFYIDEGKPTPAGFATSLRNLADVRPTWHFNVPLGYEMLVRALEADADLAKSFFSRMDMMMYAGAGMAQHTWDQLKALSKQATGREVLLVTALGATETGPFALMGTDHQPRSGNVGVPACGVTLKLVPNEGKLEARLKSPSITPGYFGAPQATADALDNEGFYMLGDALRPADPDDLTKGFFFDGRTAENFKLRTGTWVAVGALRAKLVDHFDGLLRDAVIVGEDQPFLGAIVLADMDELRKIAKGDTLAALMQNPDVRTALQTSLNSLAATATGSANKIKRMLVMMDAPSLDKGEVTDKGSINQRAVIRNRPELIQAIYDGGAGVFEAT